MSAFTLFTRPTHNLAVLASTRLFVAVLVDSGRIDADSMVARPEWLASVIAGAYTHESGRIVNTASIRAALAGVEIEISVKTAKALMEDIRDRINALPEF